MKTFKQYIVEEVLSFSDALKIFNIDRVPSTRSEFDKLYKQLALKNHPDLGGSTEAMKKLNMAKEVLSKNLGRGEKEAEKAAQDEWEAKYRAEKEQAFHIAMNFFKKIDLELYKVYFKKLFNKDFFAESKASVWKSGKYEHNAPYINIEIFTKERDIVFYLTLGCDLFRLYGDIFGQKGLSTSNVTFDYYIQSESFIENKKQVITKQKYIRSTDASVLTKPETVFPKARIEKLASGTVRQNSTLKKRDFESMITMKFKGEKGTNNYYYIPFLKDSDSEYRLAIWRTVLMKQGLWMFAYINKKGLNGFGWNSDNKGIELTYVPENQRGFDVMNNLFTEIQKKTPEQVKALINKNLAEFRK